MTNTFTTAQKAKMEGEAKNMTNEQITKRVKRAFAIRLVSRVAVAYITHKVFREAKN